MRAFLITEGKLQGVRETKGLKQNMDYQAFVFILKTRTKAKAQTHDPPPHVLFVPLSILYRPSKGG
jgi:hypothetical protein